MTEQSQHPPTDRTAARDQVLIAYLAERDTPCPSCRYNLRGVTSGSCPECGNEIAMAISIGSGAQPTVPWFLAVIAYGTAIGINGVYVLIMSLVLALEVRDMEIAAILSVTSFSLIFAITALVLVVRKRERIWSMTKRKQWLVTASVLLLPLFVFIGIVAALAIVG